jgi:hypothetical protein
MTTDCAHREPSDAEMNEAQEALARWQTPQEFAVEVENFAPLVKSSTLFNKANAGFLRDAIPIAEFTKHRAVQSLRLARQREGLNDGQFRSADEIIDIEVTEVMESGRKRGDEYRCGADQQGIRHFDPYLGETIANELAKSIKKKADKGYPTKPVLLVYLNISDGGRLGDEVESAIKRLRVEYANTFREICVLWGTKWH